MGNIMLLLLSLLVTLPPPFSHLVTPPVTSPFTSCHFFPRLIITSCRTPPTLLPPTPCHTLFTSRHTLPRLLVTSCHTPATLSPLVTLPLHILSRPPTFITSCYTPPTLSPLVTPPVTSPFTSCHALSRPLITSCHSPAPLFANP